MTGAWSLLLGLAVAAAAPAPTVALFPLPGEEGSTVADGRHALDEGVRQALAQTRTVRPVARADLERTVARARGSGIVCELSHPECAARLGAFGGLDFALLPRLEERTVTLSLVDCASGRVVREHALMLQGAPASWRPQLLALTQAVLGVAPPPEPRAAPEDTPATIAPPPNPAPPPESAAHEPIGPRVGIGVLVVGSLLGLGGLVGAAAVAPRAEDRPEVSAREYNDAVLAGRGLLVVGALGAVAASGGAALWLLGDGSAP